MKEVVDRIVQYPNRYKLTDVSTGQELGTYDFAEVPGTVQQVGTEINAKLFNSIEQAIEAVGNFDPNGTYPNLTAGKATQDEAGNNIQSTYATKAALNGVINGTTPVAKATAANSATNATNDAQGRNIASTYATKSEIPEVNLNGQDVTDSAFYAPTTYGEAGQVLVSNGAGQAPTWQDAGKDIANATVTLGASLTYNGSAQTQTVASVKLGSVTLRAGTDYDISGNVATNAGNYTLIVSGKGDYTGFVFVDWSIAKAQGSISVSETNVNVIGVAGTTKQVTVTVTSGYGDLVATSSAPNVATVSVLGNTITITSVAEGNATITVKLIGNYSAEESITANVTFVSSVLNDNTWGIVRLVADNGLGENIWAIGDTKAIPLNGRVGSYKSYDNVTVWAYILGFNHNASVEGKHLIHFGCFKTAQTDGVDVTLDNTYYRSQFSNGSKQFNMNHWNAFNHGGWSRCDMRYDILGSTDVAPDGYGASPSSGEEGHDPTSTCATSPVANTLMAALPEDLRAVMKPATKYTNNTGDSKSSAAVTATQDYLPLLAEFEVQGSIKNANGYEANYQEQYAYYANGNSKVKYLQSSTGEAAFWWCRSPYGTNAYNFCRVFSDGQPSTLGADYSLGVSPALFI